MTEDCHGGATRKSPIDLHPLRELPDRMRSMQNELQEMKAMFDSREHNDLEIKKQILRPLMTTVRKSEVNSMTFRTW